METQQISNNDEPTHHHFFFSSVYSVPEIGVESVLSSLEFVASHEGCTAEFVPADWTQTITAMLVERFFRGLEIPSK